MPQIQPDIETSIAEVRHSPYYSEDMGAIPLSQRKWGLRDIAALWISMAACVPTYMLASSAIDTGMNWWQAVLTIFLANVVVLIPMVLNAHAGTKYGIPFPVYCRASFGILGANIPAMLRALVACGWFGIQAWIGGAAIYQIGSVLFPSLREAHPMQWMGFRVGINFPQFVCFLIFWAINVLVIWKGIESIRILLNIKAPLLIVLGLALLGWAYKQANGLGPMLDAPAKHPPGGFWLIFFPVLTANVGFWATLSLNIPDFSRYAFSQRDQVLGQAIGLPPTMALYSFIGVAVTSATIVIYGESIWDPVLLLEKFKNPVVLIVAMLALCLATLATNIAANVVSPANDFAHLWPRVINFRRGGLITAVIGIVMMPWKLVSDPSGYIFRWLIAYSALLGAVGGILVIDYWCLRKTKLDLKGLYSPSGPYWYSSGFNFIAILAFVLGILPCAPGFVAAVGIAEVRPFWTQLYSYAWFIGFAISGVAYFLLMSLSGKNEQV